MGVTLPARWDAEAAAVLGRVPEALTRSRPIDLDLRPVRDLDVSGAHWLCEALRHLGEPGAPVRILGADSLLTLLTPKIQKDRREPVEPLWWLCLELLRVLDRPEAFEDCAIDYCVTYEVSPPPWSPRAAHVRAGLGAGAPEPNPSCGASAVSIFEAEGRLALRGDLDGRSTELLAGLRRLALTHPVVHLDARKLQRLDFSTAGDLLNEVLSLQAAGKRVRISGVGPMVEGLLAVMGVTPLVTADRRG
jgi:ABC-type transporter Mla MlaB component